MKSSLECELLGQRKKLEVAPAHMRMQILIEGDRGERHPNCYHNERTGDGKKGRRYKKGHDRSERHFEFVAQ